MKKSSLKWGIHFDIARKEEKIAELEYKMGEPTFWDDPDQAQKITQELNGVKAGVDKYKNILHKFEEMQILWEMGMEDKDETVCDDVEAEIKEINEAIEQLELELLLSGKYDANNAILTLHAGAGGTE